MHGPSATTRRLVVVVGLAVLAVLAMLPLVLVLDHQVDRQRAMYEDRSDMALLQHEHAKKHGEGIAVTLRPGETTTVAGVDYRPSPGTSMRVELVEDGYCVRAGNDHGDTTRWRCWSYATDPRESPGTPR